MGGWPTWWQWLAIAALLAAAWATRHHTYLPHPYRESTRMSRPGIPRRDDTFDAGSYGTLRYDFKRFGGVQGIIPDPSDEQIEAFMVRLREVAREFGDEEATVDVDTADADELNAMLEGDGLRLADAQRAVCDAISELCQGSPNADQLLRLPFRVRQGFMAWLQRKLLSPEASAADTGAAPARRIGG